MPRYFILLFLMCFACETHNDTKAGWQKVFKNDAQGLTVFGDKTLLIDAVRLGYPVRIGWGSTRVEHVSEADFLTIFEGEVFAQIKTIIGQAPSVKNDSIKIQFRAENHWTKIAGTNGYSTAFMTNYINDSIVGGNADRYTATTWYVLYPKHALSIEARPLWRDESPNWDEYNNKKD